MNSDLHHDRRAIFSLVAMGRITAREAERLLAVCPDADEAIVRLALCLAFAVLALPHLNEFFTAVEHTLGSLIPGVEAAAHHAVAFVIHWFGGLL
jgi:hypothetical protein